MVTMRFWLESHTVSTAVADIPPSRGATMAIRKPMMVRTTRISRRVKPFWEAAFFLIGLNSFFIKRFIRFIRFI